MRLIDYFENWILKGCGDKWSLTMLVNTETGFERLKTKHTMCKKCKSVVLWSLKHGITLTSRELIIPDNYKHFDRSFTSVDFVFNSINDAMNCEVYSNNEYFDSSKLFIKENQMINTIPIKKMIFLDKPNLNNKIYLLYKCNKQFDIVDLKDIKLSFYDNNFNVVSILSICGDMVMHYYNGDVKKYDLPKKMIIYDFFDRLVIYPKNQIMKFCLVERIKSCQKR
jgi:hypothetical protein